MIKKGSFSADFLVLFSGKTVEQLVPFLFAPVITRLFTETDVAVRANFLALVGMISIAAAGRYDRAIVLPAEKRKAMNLFMLGTWLTLIVSVLSLVICFFPAQVDAFYQEGVLSEYLILVSLAVALTGFNNIFTEWLVREKKYRAVTTSGIARSTFSNLFTITFGYYMWGVSGMIFGWIIGMLVPLVMMYISSRNSLDFKLTDYKGMKETAKEFRDFPLITGPHAFVDQLFSQFILFAIITREFGLVELGYFFMMWTLLQASMRAVGGAVGQLYFKEASDRHAQGLDVTHAFFRSVKIVAFFAIPACIVVLFFGPDLFGWYLGGKFTRSGIYAQVMIIPLFINFIISPVSPTPTIYRRQGWAFVFSLVGYALSILALLIGNYLGYDFYHTLMLYGGVQTLYYLWLFGWYIKLTRSSAV
jgi:O-antigen/teichoic acid export membrane protein